MDSVLALSSENTHLYRGAVLTLPPDHPLPAGSAEAVVVFSDRARAEAWLTPRSVGLLLEVGAYTTTAGTEIDAKSWLLHTDCAVRLVVTKRAA